MSLDNQKMQINHDLSLVIDGNILDSKAGSQGNSFQRYKMIIEYDGQGFLGWQSQGYNEGGGSRLKVEKLEGDGKNTFFKYSDNGLCNLYHKINYTPYEGVQDVLSRALERLGFRGIKFSGAGRTDSGVHALGQVAHCDLPVRLENEKKFLASLNYFLRPNPVVVKNIEKVDIGFNARFSAKQRRYLYRVVISRTTPVIEQGRVWHIIHSLDIERMREAAKMLVGRHDFCNFRLKSCQAKNTIRTLDQFEIREFFREEQAMQYIEFDVTARSFLHRQVRIMVGTLYQVGRGNMDLGLVKRMLSGEPALTHNYHAPPWGLYLYGVYY